MTPTQRSNLVTQLGQVKEDPVVLISTLRSGSEESDDQNKTNEAPRPAPNRYVRFSLSCSPFFFLFRPFPSDVKDRNLFEEFYVVMPSDV